MTQLKHSKIPNDGFGAASCGIEKVVSPFPSLGSRFFHHAIATVNLAFALPQTNRSDIVRLSAVLKTRRKTFKKRGRLYYDELYDRLPDK